MSNYPECSANGIRLALRASADDQGIWVMIMLTAGA